MIKIKNSIPTTLLLISSLIFLINLYLIFIWVPTEINQGIAQRIFYFHVPIAWLGMISIIIVAITSFIHLITRNEKWDNLAYSSAELGIIFASLILITGSIWAKPIWGVWWTWDPKLTTTLILWFFYLGYLMIRSYSQAGIQSKQYSSVIALIGAIDAPIIYMASVWWRSAHPSPNIPMDLDNKMLITFLISLISFTILYIYILNKRYNLKKMESKTDALYRIIN